jgi:hypothetical protein
MLIFYSWIKLISFDHVFIYWILNEIDRLEERDILALAKSKGFNSISEWRLSQALRLGMDLKNWTEIEILNPGEFLPNILIGPFQGWSKFFDNQMNTSFAQALEIPEFFEWCKAHNRIPNIAENFPSVTTFILFRKPDGKFIHIEGGHRACAVAYAQKIGKPVTFGSKSKVTARLQILLMRK